VLIDAAWPHRGQLIKTAAEQLFGPDARPDAILLTHIHPDHSGSALELAQMWDLPVYVHPDELVLAPGGYLPEYANLLDRWLVAPLLRLMPRRMVEESRSRNSLEGTALAFDPAAGVPGLPDWQAVPTPGHTPGHVAFFRAKDRVLIRRRSDRESQLGARPASRQAAGIRAALHFHVELASGHAVCRRTRQARARRARRPATAVRWPGPRQ
jgi:hypothetical protein